MPKIYDYPQEMPKVFIDDDGIVNIQFGSILITANHIVHCVESHRKLAPNKKSPVMIMGEAAMNLRNDISTVGARPETIELTSALALVTISKVAKVMGNLFISLQSNPYPTKLFDNVDDARTWLKSYR